MWYEINVSLNGRHYFATAERSLLTEDKAEEMYQHFLKLFPESEGYKVGMACWMQSGRRIHG